MSFDLNDPLAGILSDGSDDSFFDDDILGKKKDTKKKSTPVLEKKNSVFDLSSNVNSKTSNIDERKNSLFNLGDTNKKNLDTLNLDNANILEKSETGRSPIPFQRTVSKDSIQLHAPDSVKTSLKSISVKSPAKTKLTTSVDKLNLLDDILEPKKENKTIEKGKSSHSILDDILGGSSTKTGGSSQVTSRPATKLRNQELDLDNLLGKQDVKQNPVLQKKDKPIVGQKKEENQQKKSKSSDDWLGIFKEKVADDDNEDEGAGMPSWLLGADTKKKKTVETGKRETPKLQEIKNEDSKDDDIIEVKTKNDQSFNHNIEHITRSRPVSNVMQGSNDDITVEGTAIYMQQQESQLMLALQLKAQEEKLAAIQSRQDESQRIQKEAARAHHAQLEAMLQRQAAQRRQMQAVISTHQDRIYERIKGLMGPSTMETDNITENEDEDLPYVNNTNKDNPYLKEKKQLVQLLQSLQENHDKEIDLMETSYRRQLAFIEVSLNQSEERMKEESDKLVKFYVEKISWLNEHHLSYKTLTENNIESLMERHNKETQLLREQHSENLKVLQEHHAALMENIKNAVKQEQNLIQESASFSTNLLELVADVKENKSQCQTLVETVQTLTESTRRETERNLQSKDSQINEMIQQLKREREAFEIEKSENREIVKLLESRLRQMTQLVEEETAALRQKRMELEFEKATFNKQTEYAKNVLKKQDEDIKTLKEDIQKEYQEKISRLDEDKSKVHKDVVNVAKEKASLENLKQELEKMKAELQVQLEEASEERSKLNIEKQQVHMEERRISAKSRDLELLAKATVDRQSQADQKYAEAEHIQKKYEERIRRIQEHVVSLNSREKQIAREKVTLSRERLNLHNERRQIGNRQQSSINKPTFYSEYDQKYVSPETFLDVPTGVSRDYSGGNVNLAMDAIEQEMAHLLGRNLGLKPIVGDYVRGESLDGILRNDKTMTAIDANIVPINSVDSDGTMKDYMDSKLQMLRLDVQRVISNIEKNKAEVTDDTNK